MPKLDTFEDLTGRKFGKLTVLSFYGRNNKRIIFNCICDCGKETRVLAGNLKDSKSTSCGCTRRSWKTKNCKECGKAFSKRDKEAPIRFLNRPFCSKRCAYTSFNKILYDKHGNKKCTECNEFKSLKEFHKHKKGYYHYNCKKCINKKRNKWQRDNKIMINSRVNERRNYLDIKLRDLISASRQRNKKYKEIFDLDIQFVKHLWSIQNGKCFYSGITMTNINGYGRGTAKEIRSNVSIDRINSEKGYTKDNIVLCCDIVNRMKLNMSVSDFLNIIEILFSYQKSKKEVSLAKAI